MQNQKNRPTRAEIETRRWQIGTAIAIIGVVLSVVAVWPKDDAPTVPGYFIAGPDARPPAANNQKIPDGTGLAHPSIQRVPYSAPLSADDRKK